MPRPVIGGPYVALLRTRHVPLLAGSLVLFGTGVAMSPLGIVLFAKQSTGSFGRASVVVAAGTLGIAVLSPLRGRWVDRRGMSRPLYVTALVRTAALAGLIPLGKAGAPTAALAAASLIAGAASPPLASSVRMLWKDVVREESQLSAAFALFAMLNEVTLFAGPLIAGLLVAVASPSVVIGAAAAFSLVAVLAFVRSPVARGHAAELADGTAGRLGAIASPGLRTLLGATFAFGLTFGQLENIALPAFATAHGSSAAAGILLAAIALGIAAGSFLYGLRSSARAAGRLFPWLCALSAVGLLPALAASSIPVMAVLMLVTGLLFAPATVCVFTLIDDVTPPAAHAEAFGWLSSLSFAGAAVGSVVAGVVVDGPGVRAALAGAAAASAAAFLIVLTRRGTLASADDTRRL